MPAGQRAQGTFIARRSVSLHGWCHDAAGQAEVPVTDTGIWEARAAVSPVALPAGLIPQLGPRAFLLPGLIPGRFPPCLTSRDLWDAQICSRFGTGCSPRRVHKAAAPLHCPGTFGHLQPKYQMGSLPRSHRPSAPYLKFKEPSPSSFPIPGNVVPKFLWKEGWG